MSFNICKVCGKPNGVVNTTIYQCDCARNNYPPKPLPAEPAATVCPLGKCDGGGVLYYNGDGLASPSGSIECLCKKTAAAAPQGLSNLSPEEMTAHSGTINGMPTAPADSTPQYPWCELCCDSVTNPSYHGIGKCVSHVANSTRPEPLSAHNSGTYGELPQSLRDAERVEPHVWDNMNVTEQRDWLIRFVSTAAPWTLGSEPDDWRESLQTALRMPNLPAEHWSELIKRVRAFAAQPQPAPRPPVCPKCGHGTLAFNMNTCSVICDGCREVTRLTMRAYFMPLSDFAQFFTAIPAQKEEQS